MSIVNIDSFFWFCALAGTGMFLVQLVLSFLGNGADELDENSAVDAGKMKWLSRQAVTGFLMMFGLSALTCKNQFGLALALTAVIALTSGALAVVIIGFIFKLARKLQSTGTVFLLENALGKEAVVYQKIPRGGMGKISISLQQLTYEIDAISFNGEEISSFFPVQVIKLTGDGKVVVAPIKQ
jgi:hypothetical protein